MTDHDHSLCILAEGVEAFCLLTRKPGPCVGQKRGMYQAQAAADLATPGATQGLKKAIPGAPVRNAAAEAARQAAVDQGVQRAHQAQLLQATGGLKGSQQRVATAAQAQAKQQITKAVGEDTAYERRLGQQQRAHDSGVKQDATAQKVAANKDATAQRVAAHKATAAAKKQANAQVRAGKKAAAAAKKSAASAPKAPVSVAQWLQYGVDGADTVAFWLAEFGDAAVPAATIPLEGVHMAAVFGLYGLEAPDPYLYGTAALGHESCWIGQFCRDPLHPGPCKGSRRLAAPRLAPPAPQKSLEAHVRERHPGVHLSLSEGAKSTRISLIRTPEDQRGKGLAGAAMRTLTEEADRRGHRLTLTPEPLAGDKKTSKAKLTSWYKAHGFVDNKGRSKDYEVSDTMYREPKGVQASAMTMAHDACDVGQFCRNPLHPGPCKGWKHMLHAVSPGAWHAIERQRVDKLEARRKAKVAALQAQGLKVPPRLLKPTEARKAPTGAAPNPMHWQKPTAAQAQAALPPTSKQIGLKIAARHDPTLKRFLDKKDYYFPKDPIADPANLQQGHVVPLANGGLSGHGVAQIAGPVVKHFGEDHVLLREPGKNPYLSPTKTIKKNLGDLHDRMKGQVPGQTALPINNAPAGHIPAAPAVPAPSGMTPRLQHAADASSALTDSAAALGRALSDDTKKAVTRHIHDALGKLKPGEKLADDAKVKATIDGLVKHADGLAQAAGKPLTPQQLDSLRGNIADHVNAGVPDVPILVTSVANHAGINAPAAPAAPVLSAAQKAARDAVSSPSMGTNAKLDALDGISKADFDQLDDRTKRAVAGMLHHTGTLAPTTLLGQKADRIHQQLTGSRIPAVAAVPPANKTPAGHIPAAPSGGGVAAKATPTPRAPMAPGTPAHVQHASAMAHRSAPGAGVAKKQLPAYAPLTKDEFDALPDATRTQILTDLTAAHAKFLDPKKKAEAQGLLDRFGGKGSTPAAPAVHAPAAPATPAKAATSQARDDAMAVLKTPHTTSASIKLPIFQKLTKADYDSMPPAHQEALKRSLDEADRAGMHKAGVDAVRANLGLPAATPSTPAAHPGAYSPAQRHAADLAGPKVNTSTDRDFVNAAGSLGRADYHGLSDADKKAVHDRLAGIGSTTAPDAAAARAHLSRLAGTTVTPTHGGTPTTTPQPVRDAQVLLNSPAWHNTSPARKLDLFRDLKADHFGKLTPAEQDKIKAAVDAVDKLGSHANAVAEARKRLGLPTPARGGQLRQDLQDVLDDKTLTPAEKITALPWNLDSNRFHVDLTDDQRKHVLDLLQHVADSQAYTNDQKADAALMHSRLTGKILRTLPQTGASHGPIAALNSESWDDPLIVTPDAKAKALGKLDKRLYDALNHKQKARADAALKELEAAGHPDVAAIRSNLGLAPAGVGHPVLDGALASGDPHQIIGAYSRVFNGSRTAAESKALADFRHRVENDPKHPDWLRTAMYADRAGYGNAAARVAGEPPSPSGKWFTTYSRLGDLAAISDADKAKLPDYVRRSIDDRLSEGVRDSLNVGSKINTLQAVFGDKLDKLDRYDKLSPQAKQAVDSALRAVRDQYTMDPKKMSAYQRAIDTVDKTAYHPHQQAAIDMIHNDHAAAFDRTTAYETLGKDHYDKLPAAHKGAIATDLLNTNANAQGGATRQHARHTIAKLGGIMPGYASPHAQDAALAATIDKLALPDDDRAARYAKLLLATFGPMHTPDKVAIGKDMEALANGNTLPLADRFTLQEKHDYLTHAMWPTTVGHAIDSARPSGTFLPEQTRIANYGALSQGDHAALPRVYRDAIEADLHKLSVGHPNAFNVLMQKFNPGWTPPAVAPQSATPVMSNTAPAVKDALDALYGLHPKSQHVSHQLKTYGALRTAQFDSLQPHEKQTLLADLSYIATTSVGLNATKAQKIIDRFTPPGTPAGHVPSQAIIPPVNAVAGQVRDPNPAGTAGSLKMATSKGLNGDGYGYHNGIRMPWGKYGAAGIMLRHVDANGTERYLMVQRGPAISDPGMWQFPGGAIDSLESPHQGATREVIEELGFKHDALESARVHGHHEFKQPGTPWKYTSIVATTDKQLVPDLSTHHARAETADAKWMTIDEIRALDRRGKMLDPLAGGKIETNVMSLFPNAAHQPGAGVARPGPVTKKPARLTGTPLAPKPVKAHKPSKGRNLLASTAAKDQLRQDVKTSRRAYAGKTADDRLAAIGAMQGYDDTPTVHSKAEVDRLLKTGDYIEVWRGVKRAGYGSGAKSAADINEEMRSGPAYYGTGIFGNGYYLAADKNVAKQYSDGTKNSIARILIPKDAVMVTHDKVKRDAHANSTPFSKAKGGSRESGTLYDPGRYGAATGLDGIEIEPHSQPAGGGWARHVSKPGQHAYNWLNRSVLIIQEAE